MFCLSESNVTNGNEELSTFANNWLVAYDLLPEKACDDCVDDLINSLDNHQSFTFRLISKL